MIIKFTKETFAHRTKASSRYSENINDALGYDLTDKHTTVASYGGVGSQTGGMHHGHGGKSPEEDIDTEKFFLRRKTINDNYSGPSGLPLILAALPEHQNLFIR
jgi:hypothetical protein